MNARITILGKEGSDSEPLSKLIAAMGHEVASLTPGKELTAQLASEQPDCLLIDGQVDGLDLVGLIKEVRLSESLNSIKLIVAGNSQGTTTPATLLVAGADMYINDPADEEEIKAKLNVVLRQRHRELELKKQVEAGTYEIEQLKIDLNLGRDVQRSFLPPHQLKTDRFRLQARMVGGGDLSGDYYDYKLITPQRLALFLADVSGHGIASALFASRLKAYFDENCRRAHRPRLFLERLNRVLLGLGDHYHLATAVCVHIDLSENIITYASAGHRTMHLVDTDAGKYSELPVSGPAMGMFEEFDINESTRSFIPDHNRLVVYSDGLVEFKLPDGTWLKEQQFTEEVILPGAHLPIKEYTDLLMTRSREMTNMDTWEDDVSLLVVDF